MTSPSQEVKPLPCPACGTLRAERLEADRTALIERRVFFTDDSWFFVGRRPRQGHIGPFPNADAALAAFRAALSAQPAPKTTSEIPSVYDHLKAQKDARLAELVPRCDCGDELTQCSGCAVAEWQAMHTDCKECCPPSAPHPADDFRGLTPDEQKAIDATLQKGATPLGFTRNYDAPQPAEPTGAKPEIICLSGSSRFIDVMAVLGWGFEKEGKIAIGLHLLPAWYTDVRDHIAEHEGCAAHMDELHLRKIDLCNRVFVVNKDGYIGDSTRREIAYAERIGKPVVWRPTQPNRKVGTSK